MSPGQRQDRPVTHVTHNYVFPVENHFYLLPFYIFLTSTHIMILERFFLFLLYNVSAASRKSKNNNSGYVSKFLAFVQLFPSSLTFIQAKFEMSFSQSICGKVDSKLSGLWNMLGNGVSNDCKNCYEFRVQVNQYSCVRILLSAQITYKFYKISTTNKLLIFCCMRIQSLRILLPQFIYFLAFVCSFVRL